MANIDIERFPTSPTAQRMLRRVSPIYNQAYTAKWLFQVMGLEFDEARRIVQELREQEFPDTVTWAIEFWEHRYSITPNPNLTIEERRARLKRKMLPRYPLSPGKFEEIIKASFDILADIDETHAPGVFKMTINGNKEKGFDPLPLYKFIYDTKPSHLSTAVELKEEIHSTRYVGIYPEQHKRLHVLMAVMEDTTAEQKKYIGIGNSVHKKMRVELPLVSDETVNRSKRVFIGITQHRKLQIPMGVPVPPETRHAGMAATQHKKILFPIERELQGQQNHTGLYLTYHRKVAIQNG